MHMPSRPASACLTGQAARRAHGLLRRPSTGDSDPIPSSYSEYTPPRPPRPPSTLLHAQHHHAYNGRSSTRTCRVPPHTCPRHGFTSTLDGQPRPSRVSTIVLPPRCAPQLLALPLAIQLVFLV